MSGRQLNLALLAGVLRRKDLLSMTRGSTLPNEFKGALILPQCV